MRAAGGPSCRLHRFGCFRHRRRNPRNKGEPMAQHVQTTQTHPLQGSKDHKINKNPKNNFLLVMTYHQQFQIVFQWSAWLVGHSCCSTAQRSDFWVPAVGTKKYMNLWGTLPWIPICWNTTKTMNDKKQDPKTKKEHASEKKHPSFHETVVIFLNFPEFSDNTRSPTRMSLPALVLDAAMLEAVAWDGNKHCSWHEQACTTAWWKILKC